MIWYVLIGLFAAYGLFVSLWILFGAWLTGYQGGTVVVHCPEGQVEKVVRRYRFFRQLGLVRSRLVLVTEQAQSVQEDSDIEMISPEEYLRRLEQERKEIDGT